MAKILCKYKSNLEYNHNQKYIDIGNQKKNQAQSLKINIGTFDMKLALPFTCRYFFLSIKPKSALMWTKYINLISACTSSSCWS